MSKTLTLPDELYDRLAQTAHASGHADILQLLEAWQAEAAAPAAGKNALAAADEIREQLYARYGLMPDSADLIREDRER